MTPDEIAQHLTEATGAVERSEVVHGEVSVWVPREKWQEVGRHLRTCGRCRFDFFTFLAAVDLEGDGFEIVCHVYSVPRAHHVNLRTIVPRDDPTLPTLSVVWRGANWHERETWELFGVVFDGHPHLIKLVLSEQFEGYPMRKSFALMSREAKPWPGAVEGEEVED
jgi:NADH-quinone oxidoreductase subunit C